MRRLMRIGQSVAVDSLAARHQAFLAREGREYQFMPKALDGASRPAHESVGKARKIRLTQDQEELCEVLGQKPGYLARQMLSQGIDIGSALNAGVNPFVDARPKYMRTVCGALLEGGFTKKSLKERLLQAHPDWEPRTADSQVTTAVSCLAMMGVITEGFGKRYILK